MLAGPAGARRTAIAFFSACALIASCLFAGIALADTTFQYDEAGHLTSVRNTDDDPGACGRSQEVCPSDAHGRAICVGGACGLECDSGWTDVGGRCADTSTDPTTCGANLDFCPSPQNGTAKCVGGVCGASCYTGFVASGTKCVSLSSDPTNCGSVGKKCANVPGYLACCSTALCGASTDGATCVNVTTDPSNCGWIGHVCATVNGKAASCSKGRCTKATGTPRIDRVNGIAPSGRAFRSPFWSGLTLSGANLDLVTWVELEDWGADTVDGTPEGVQADPFAKAWTIPTGTGGPTIHFQQSSTTLTVDAASLEFQGAFDGGLQTRHWLKARVHYTSSGVDRSVLVDVAVSLTDLVSQGLPPPTITSVSSYGELYAADYDPATGLIPLYDDPTMWSLRPSAVMLADLQRELPVLRVAPEGLYIAKGLDPRQFVGAWMVVPYDLAASVAPISPSMGLILRGTNLWDDGPLRFTDASGNVLGELPSALFSGSRVVTSSALNAPSRLAFVEFASMRGTARTPGPLEFTGQPTLLRLQWGGRTVELENQRGWPQMTQEHLPVGVVLTIVGRWLRNIDHAEFEAPNRTWTSCDANIPTTREPLIRVYGTPGPNQFRIVDDEHIEVRIDADLATDVAQRGRVFYCTCGNYCWEFVGGTSYQRRIHFTGSAPNVYPSLEMTPVMSQFVQVMAAECGDPAGTPFESPLITIPDLGDFLDPPGADCSNAICL